MTAEELYQKEFGNADNIPKESVIRLLRTFVKALKSEREAYKEEIREWLIAEDFEGLAERL